VRGLEILENPDGCVPVGFRWVAKVLGQSVDGKGDVRPSTLGDPQKAADELIIGSGGGRIGRYPLAQVCEAGIRGGLHRYR
jgi:hypothetical protein